MSGAATLGEDLRWDTITRWYKLLGATGLHGSAQEARETSEKRTTPAAAVWEQHAASIVQYFQPLSAAPAATTTVTVATATAADTTATAARLYLVIVGVQGTGKTYLAHYAARRLAETVRGDGKEELNDKVYLATADARSVTPISIFDLTARLEQWVTAIQREADRLPMRPIPMLILENIDVWFQAPNSKIDPMMLSRSLTDTLRRTNQRVRVLFTMRAPYQVPAAFFASLQPTGVMTVDLDLPTPAIRRGLLQAFFVARFVRDWARRLDAWPQFQGAGAALPTEDKDMIESLVKLQKNLGPSRDPNLPFPMEEILLGYLTRPSADRPVPLWFRGKFQEAVQQTLQQSNLADSPLVTLILNATSMRPEAPGLLLEYLRANGGGWTEGLIHALSPASTSQTSSEAILLYGFDVAQLFSLLEQVSQFAEQRTRQAFWDQTQAFLPLGDGAPGTTAASCASAQQTFTHGTSWTGSLLAQSFPACTGGPRELNSIDPRVWYSSYDWTAGDVKRAIDLFTQQRLSLQPHVDYPDYVRWVMFGPSSAMTRHLAKLSLPVSFVQSAPTGFIALSPVSLQPVQAPPSPLSPTPPPPPPPPPPPSAIVIPASTAPASPASPAAATGGWAGNTAVTISTAAIAGGATRPVTLAQIGYYWGDEHENTRLTRERKRELTRLQGRGVPQRTN